MPSLDHYFYSTAPNVPYQISSSKVSIPHRRTPSQVSISRSRALICVTPLTSKTGALIPRPALNSTTGALISKTSQIADRTVTCYDADPLKLGRPRENYTTPSDSHSSLTTSQLISLLVHQGALPLPQDASLLDMTPPHPEHPQHLTRNGNKVTVITDKTSIHVALQPFFKGGTGSQVVIVSVPKNTVESLGSHFDFVFQSFKSNIELEIETLKSLLRPGGYLVSSGPKETMEKVAKLANASLVVLPTHPEMGVVVLKKKSLRSARVVCRIPDEMRANLGKNHKGTSANNNLELSLENKSQKGVVSQLASWFGF